MASGSFPTVSPFVIALGEGFEATCGAGVGVGQSVGPERRG